MVTDYERMMNRIVQLFVVVSLGHTLRTNLALNKPARESSTRVSHPSKAVDGNTNQVFDDGSCSHTKDGIDQWWEVDLQGFHQIDTVTITNRIDCCSNRLTNISISVSLNDRLQFQNEDSVLCATYPGSIGSKFTLTCRTGVWGRFVRITV